MSSLQMALEPSTLVVAADPGKVMNRVRVSDGSGLFGRSDVAAGFSCWGREAGPTPVWAANWAAGWAAG